jgi:hypothetical protein
MFPRPLLPVLCDKPASPGGLSIWDISNSRNGKFLNVPIFYGDWVPINNAKSVLQRVAASLNSAANERVDQQQTQQLQVQPQHDGHDRHDHAAPHAHNDNDDVGNIDHTHDHHHAQQVHPPAAEGHQGRHKQNLSKNC